MRGRRARGAVLVADLEGQNRSFGVGERDLHPVPNVDGAHPPAIDVHPVEAAVVDGNPAPMAEPQNQMFTRDQRVGNPYVGSDVAPDDDVVAGHERARRSVVAHSQRGRCWSAHRDQHPGVATTNRLWYSFTRMSARVVDLFVCAMASFVAATPSTAPITPRRPKVNAMLAAVTRYSVWATMVRSRCPHRHQARNRLSVRSLFITSSAATL